MKKFTGFVVALVLCVSCGTESENKTSHRSLSNAEIEAELASFNAIAAEKEVVDPISSDKQAPVSGNKEPRSNIGDKAPYSDEGLAELNALYGEYAELCRTTELEEVQSKDGSRMISRPVFSDSAECLELKAVIEAKILERKQG